VGSPWAIGSADGGHDAIAPELGTFDDFDDFVARARDLGMEVALDFAAPVRAGPPLGRRAPRVVHRAPRRHHRLRGEPAEEVPGHLPGQLRQRPRGIYAESLRWCCTGSSTGVRIFRVDNPHTKPPNFWHWLIWQVKA
jgi:starch synthase (maltosyl-transferring)